MSLELRKVMVSDRKLHEKTLRQVRSIVNQFNLPLKDCSHYKEHYVYLPDQEVTDICSQLHQIIVSFFRVANHFLNYGHEKCATFWNARAHELKDAINAIRYLQEVTTHDEYSVMLSAYWECILTDCEQHMPYSKRVDVEYQGEKAIFRWSGPILLTRGTSVKLSRNLLFQ